jgi:hypothetical protein
MVGRRPTAPARRWARRPSQNLTISATWQTWPAPKHHSLPPLFVSFVTFCSNPDSEIRVYPCSSVVNSSETRGLWSVVRVPSCPFVVPVLSRDRTWRRSSSHRVFPHSKWWDEDAAAAKDQTHDCTSRRNSSFVIRNSSFPARRRSAPYRFAIVRSTTSPSTAHVARPTPIGTAVPFCASPTSAPDVAPKPN